MKIQKALVVILLMNILGTIPLFGQNAAFSNSDVLRMLGSGLSEEIITLKMSASNCRFDTSSGALAELKSAGASDDLIILILKTEYSPIESQHKGEIVADEPRPQSRPASESTMAMLGCPPVPSTDIISTSLDKKSLNQLKNRIFMLKTHKSAFGISHYSRWDQREIYEQEVYKESGTVWVGGVNDWKFSYFVSLQPYIVKDVKYRKKENDVEVKLHATDAVVGTELKLSFTPSSEFGQLFSTLFFHRDNTKSYETAINCRLAERYIDTQFDTSGVSQEEKISVIRQLKILSSAGRPEIKARDDGAYPRVQLYDSTAYNTRQVVKNQRISSTLETVMQQAKQKVSTADVFGSEASDLFQGYVLYWAAYYRDFVDEELNHSDTIELDIQRDVFIGYIEGNLSIFEVVQKSVLRVNGDKYTLTTYDPLG